MDCSSFLLYCPLSFFLFSGGTGVWIWSLPLARQAFHHLSHSTSSVCFVNIWVMLKFYSKIKVGYMRNCAKHVEVKNLQEIFFFSWNVLVLIQSCWSGGISEIRGFIKMWQILARKRIRFWDKLFQLSTAKLDSVLERKKKKSLLGLELKEYFIMEIGGEHKLLILNICWL